MSDLCTEIARMGKGIGNENRYRILQVLMQGPRTVSEVAAHIKRAQPAVSQNLKVLKEANLVVDERRGKEVYYSIHVAYMAKLLRALVKDMGPEKKSKIPSK